jgi:beta-glucosidase
MHLNHALLTDVLKGELGFGGFVLSDYNACYQLGLSNRDGLAACLNAGVDAFMVFAFSGGRTVYRDTMANLRATVDTCAVPLARVEDAARRIVGVKCEMGLRPGAHVPIDRTLTAAVGSAAHRQVARRAVQKSLVLLKNDGHVLPLSKTNSIVALGGNSADNTGNQCGGWTITWQGMTGNGVPGATSVRAALETAVGADRVVYALDGSKQTATAGAATVGLIVVGELPYSEGKGDRAELNIPAEQVSVARAMKQAGLPTVVVLMTGRPMILGPILPYADALVAAWLPGSEGAGVTDVLLGDVPPTGKLPHSWPRTMEQIPINDGDDSYDPLYPYGFGLAY